MGLGGEGALILSLLFFHEKLCGYRGNLNGAPDPLIASFRDHWKRLRSPQVVRVTGGRQQSCLCLKTILEKCSVMFTAILVWWTTTMGAEFIGSDAHWWESFCVLFWVGAEVRSAVIMPCDWTPVFRFYALMFVYVTVAPPAVLPILKSFNDLKEIIIRAVFELYQLFIFWQFKLIFPLF